MAIELGTIRDPKTGTAYLQIIPQPALTPIVELLRSLKRQFKDEWRAVHYEIEPPQHGGLVLPSGAKPTSEGAENVADEARNLGTPNEDPIGIGQAVESD